MENNYYYNLVVIRLINNRETISAITNRYVRPPQPDTLTAAITT